MQGIFALANDASVEVKRKVCQAFVTLLEVRNEYLRPYLVDVIKYMLHTTQQVNEEDLAIDACEFWTALAEYPAIAMEVLLPFLPQ